MNNVQLSHLFGSLRHRIICDLSQNGIPTSVAGACLNWYSPDNPNYLLNVDEWKQLLCRGASYATLFPRALLEWGLLKETPYHTVVINDDMDWAIPQIHELVNFVYKAHAPARKETDWDAVKKRLSSPPELSLTDRDVRRLRSSLRRIDVLPDLDGLGCYGPGITCEGLSPFDRWMRRGWIPPVPPSWYRWNVFDRYEPSVASDIRYTRIAEVPKNLKSNRIISSEPGQSMFAQKALWSFLDPLMHRFWKDSVHLHDQKAHNALLRDPDYRTIDLSDASDYVSCDLVSKVLPTLWPLLASVRSTHALFPDGELVPLRTFAPMGSGICFPILTLVHLAVGETVCRHPYSVYGDDGIFHKDDVLDVMEWLTACGLVVNQGKTCVHGMFRESCGVEYYGMREISPCYIRDLPREMDWCKLNEVCEKLTDLGWFGTRDEICRQAVDVVRYRWNPRYQRREVLVPVTIRSDREKRLDGYEGLRKWYFTRNPAREEPDSVVRTVKGRTKRVYRYRAETDYPCLMECLDSIHIPH